MIMKDYKADEGLQGNDKIEKAIAGLQKETTQEMLAHTLTVIRRRMKDAGQLIIAVEPPSGDGQLRLEAVRTEDGKNWWVAFTSFEEELKGGGSVKSTFLTDIDKLFELTLQTDEIEGVILNPWNRTIMLDKYLIEIILEKLHKFFYMTDTIIVLQNEREEAGTMILKEKERTTIEDLQTQEKSCIEKYGRYAQQAKDPELKNLFQTLQQKEREHYDSLDCVLRGEVPQCNCNDSDGRDYQPKATYTAMSSPEDKQQDSFLATDCIATEKLVSGEYNSEVFAFGDSGVRKLLADIQVEEQNHAEMLYKYKMANNMA